MKSDQFFVAGIDLSQYVKQFEGEAVTFHQPPYHITGFSDTLYPIPDPAVVDLVYTDWYHDFGFSRKVSVEGPRIEPGLIVYDLIRWDDE